MELFYANNTLSAFLVEIVRTFENTFSNNYLGRTATQKLAYFSKVTGVPIPCSFEIYNYGPYSDQITFSMDSLLADEILVDVSTNPQRYSNYKLADPNVRFGPEIRNQVLPHITQIERVVKALGQFEPPKLELVATLHFVAKRLQSLAGTATKAAVIREFIKVKGVKFSKNEISSWFDALKRAGLL